MVLMVFVLVCGQVYADAPELGDISDGNRSVPVHVIDELIDTEGAAVDPEADDLMPFSIEKTCAECHSVDVITCGWHFNAHKGAEDPCCAAPAGKRGQPWILVDQQTGTQLPLSYRDWPGTWNPAEIGLSRFDFLQHFGTHHPGGFSAEKEVSDEEFDRWYVSGKLEVNCLLCHDESYGFDHAEYAHQIKNENFRWAATGSCDFAVVTGSAEKMDDLWDYLLPMVEDPKLAAKQPEVWYDKDRFLSGNKLVMEIVRDIPAERCYYCHSTTATDMTGYDRWKADEDVHMTAGMTCVDCHRNGMDHMMVRGYAGENEEDVRVASLSCEGCHMGIKGEKPPVAGRLSAPHPEHEGIPPIHFEVMTCTACHAGPWPEKQPHNVKISRAHKLGMHGVIKDPCALPHIQSPVFVEDAITGKLAPQKLLWPSFWGRLAGDRVKPLLPDAIKAVAEDVLPKPIDNIDLYRRGKWFPLSDETVVTVLQKLAEADEDAGKPVFITGGLLYRLNEGGKLASEDHADAQPYGWSYGHDVRPASQSLGLTCSECHDIDNDAPFFFANVPVDTPLLSRQGASVPMVDMQSSVDGRHIRFFNMTFLFRPMLKILVFIVSGILALFILAFAFKAIYRITNVVKLKQ